MEKNQNRNNLLLPLERLLRLLRSPWIACVLLVSCDSFALFDNYWTCAQSCGRANTGIALHNGAASLALNPAAALTRQKADIVFSSAKLFGLDVRFVNAACKFLIKNITVGILAESLGNQKYSEDCCLFNSAVEIYKHFYCGASLRCGRIGIMNYGSASALMLDIGTLVLLSDTVTWGTCIQNISNAVIGPGREELPQVMKTGCACRPNDHVILALELVKDVRFPLDFRCGVETHFIKNLILRTGMCTSPVRFSAGFGLRLASFGLDYAFLSHTDLNPTHVFSVGFSR